MPLSEPHNISDLVGGVDTDLLTKQGGIWQGSSPLGLSYDGAILGLDGNSLALINGGAISVDDTGSIEIVGSGNIEQSGTGNIEISGGGSLMVSAGGTVEIEGAGGKLIISSGEANALLLENGSSILIEGAGGIVLDGSGDIVLGGDLVASVGSGPAVRNRGATGLTPVFVPNQADDDSGYTRSGVNQLSHVCGGVESLRVRSTTATIAAHSNLLVFDYDNGALNIVSFGADDSGGAGFKLCRVNN